MNKMLRFCFALAAIILLLTACGGKPEPQEFINQEGNFSIMSPLTLEESSQTVDTAAGPIEIHFFMADDGNSAYMVGYSDYPAEIVELSDPNEMLDGAAQGATANINGTLVSQNNISLDGHPGRELVLTATLEDVDATAKARIYLVGNRLYQVLALGAEGDISPEDMDAFLQSFKLLEK